MAARKKRRYNVRSWSPQRADTLPKEQYLEKQYTDPGSAGSFSGPGKLKEIANIDRRTDISRGDINRF